MQCASGLLQIWLLQGLQDMLGIDKGRTGLGQAASARAWPLGPVPGRFRLAGLWKDLHHLERHPNSPTVAYSDPLTQPMCVYFKLPHPAVAQASRLLKKQ